MKELFADPVIPPNCDGLPRDNILTVLAISPLSRCRPWYRLYRKDLAICYMFYRSTVFASEHWKITSGTEPNSLLAKFRVPVRTRCAAERLAVPCFIDLVFLPRSIGR